MKEKKVGKDSFGHVKRNCIDHQYMNINRKNDSESREKENIEDGSPPLLSSPPKKSSTYKNHEMNFVPMRKPDFGANSSNDIEFMHHIDEAKDKERTIQINSHLTRSHDFQLSETSTRVNITNASNTILDREASNNDEVNFSEDPKISIGQNRKRKTHNLKEKQQISSKKQTNSAKRRINANVTNSYSNQTSSNLNHIDSNWNENIDKRDINSTKELNSKNNKKKELGVKRPRSIALDTCNEGKRNFFDLLSPTPTRRGGIHRKSTIDPQRCEKSPSLFGAVMNRAFTNSPFTSQSKTNYQQGNSSNMTSFESPIKSKPAKIHSKNDLISSPTDNCNVIYNTHISSPSKNHTPTKKTSSFQSPPHSKSNSHSNSNLTLNSPGGYTLLKVLDSINNTTPSRYQSPFRNNNDICNNSNSQISSISSNKNDPHIDDWYEAELEFLQQSNHDAYSNNAPRQGYVMDWNIKNKFKIDCFPGRCLTTLPVLNTQQHILNNNIYESISNNTTQPSTPSTINTASFEKFSSKPCPKNNENGDEDILSYIDTLWKSALLYWQHPTSNYDPDFIKMWNGISLSQNNDKQHAIAMTSLTKKKPYVNKNKDDLSSSQLNHESKKQHYNNSPSQHPILLSLRKLHTNENNLKHTVDKRWKEWQAAFRSMYFSWWNRINSMNTSMTAAKAKKVQNTYCTNAQEFHNLPSFYVLNRVRTVETSPYCHQVFLFRLSCVENEKAQPVILLSNISPSIANQLKQMGVILQNYSKPETIKTVVSKNTLMSGTSNSSTSQNNKSHSKRLFPHESNNSTTREDIDDFQKELEALRFASTHEETAGGEIFVQLQRGSSTKNAGPDINLKDLEKPIMIQGWADCHAFYEALLNTRPNFSFGEDVPLLLSRTLGSTLHSTLSSLVVKKTCKLDISNEAKYDLQNDTSSQELASVEVKGLILPCAARQLIHATALNLLLDKHLRRSENICGPMITTRDLNLSLEELFQKEGEIDLSNNSEISDDDGVGSHYFVAHLEAFDSGKNLNGALPSDNEDIAEKSPKIQSIKECKKGEITSMFVWNIVRPNIIMYKTEKV